MLNHGNVLLSFFSKPLVQWIRSVDSAKVMFWPEDVEKKKKKKRELSMTSVARTNQKPIGAWALCRTLNPTTRTPKLEVGVGVGGRGVYCEPAKRGKQ